jgi:hypothetical protein
LSLTGATSSQLAGAGQPKAFETVAMEAAQRGST